MNSILLHVLPILLSSIFIFIKLILSCNKEHPNGFLRDVRITAFFDIAFMAILYLQFFFEDVGFDTIYYTLGFFLVNLAFQLFSFAALVANRVKHVAYMLNNEMENMNALKRIDFLPKAKELFEKHQRESLLTEVDSKKLTNIFKDNHIEMAVSVGDSGIPEANYTISIENHSLLYLCDIFFDKGNAYICWTVFDQKKGRFIMWTGLDYLFPEGYRPQMPKYSSYEEITELCQETLELFTEFVQERSGIPITSGEYTLSKPGQEDKSAMVMVYSGDRSGIVVDLSDEPIKKLSEKIEYIWQDAKADNKFWEKLINLYISRYKQDLMEGLETWTVDHQYVAMYGEKEKQKQKKAGILQSAVKNFLIDVPFILRLVDENRAYLI